MTDAERLQDWARAVAAACPELDAEGRRIVVHTYRLLALGAPVSASEIADAAEVTAERVEERLDSWPLVFRDDRGRVVGFWGLAVEPQEPTHLLEVDGRKAYAWCAWDTLFLTEILGTETRVTSTDPRDGTPVRLTVTPAGVARVQPAEAVVSLLLPEEDFGAETIQQFCHRIHFFSSRQSAEEWIGDRPGMFVVVVDEAFELGRLTNELRLGVDHLPGRSGG